MPNFNHMFFSYSGVFKILCSTYRSSNNPKKNELAIVRDGSDYD
jgi:hypothetical protein